MTSKKKVVENDRLISKPEVLDRSGVSYKTLWGWMQEGKFPRSRDVDGEAYWLGSEFDRWIADRPVRQLKGDAERAARS